MVNSKARKPAKTTTKKKSTVQKKKPSAKKKLPEKKAPSGKKVTSRKKQPQAKKATSKSAVKKKTKGTGTKVVAQKKPLKKGVSKGKSTINIRKADNGKLKKVENVIEKLSRSPEPSVRVTVPGVLRMASSAPKSVPSVQNTIPIVEIKNYLKNVFGGNT